MNAQELKIGIIGCGAATEKLHLPALEKLKLTPALLVDPNLQRVQALGAKFKVPRVAQTYDATSGEINAAIVAAPHHLHARVSSDLLRQGVHVLVEKPLATTEAGCLQVVESAHAGGAVLAVGLMRRFLHRLQWVRAALDAGLVGEVESFDIREGAVYGWPVASSFFFKKETAGGGVLADTGAHTLDLVVWWFGQPVSLEYRDDNYGGVEADCTLSLTFANGLKGFVELSRTRNLRNSAMIRGRRGEIEVGLPDLTVEPLRAHPTSLLEFKHAGFSGSRSPAQRYRELFVLQIEDWVRAIRRGTAPTVTGTEATRSVALIEACYGQRQPLHLPWERPSKSEQPAPSAVGV